MSSNWAEDHQYEQISLIKLVVRFVMEFLFVEGGDRLFFHEWFLMEHDHSSFQALTILRLLLVFSKFLHLQIPTFYSQFREGLSSRRGSQNCRFREGIFTGECNFVKYTFYWR